MTAQPTDWIDLRPSKETVARLLPVSHPLRVALQQEPDFLPRDIGRAKIEAYLWILLSLPPSL
jgi:hypothetical protein